MNTLNKSVGGEGHQKNSDDGNEKHGKYTVKFYPKDWRHVRCGKTDLNMSPVYLS